MSERRAGGASRPWLTVGVGSVGAASFFSDAGHEMVTSILPTFVTSTQSVVRRLAGVRSFRRS